MPIMERPVLNNMRYSVTAVKLALLGIIATIGIAFLVSYFQTDEYPKLLKSDSITEIVQSVVKDRRGSFVTFKSNKKYHIPWAQNFKHKDFPSLTEIISIGDTIVKKPSSDTIKVRRAGKEYMYILNQTIQKLP